MGNQGSAFCEETGMLQLPGIEDIFIEDGSFQGHHEASGSKERRRMPCRVVPQYSCFQEVQVLRDCDEEEPRELLPDLQVLLI